MDRPVGPPLTYPTELLLSATWTASPASTQPTTTVAPTIADVRPSQHHAGLTDVIRAVRVDSQSQRVTTLEFPCDLWVEIPGIEHSLGTDHQKLNTASAYGGIDNGPSLMARTRI